MGQEIADSHFKPEDFQDFSRRLANETRLLEQWFTEGDIPQSDHVGGFELEAWLLDRQARPKSVNQELLRLLQDPLVVPELARFNLELNGSPQPLQGAALSRLADELAVTWAKCNQAAKRFDTRLAMIGILPTVVEQDLTTDNMSSMQRYQALDEQLARLRGGGALEMDIAGRERLSFRHEDVMLESATTSFQVHLKVNAESAGRFYNAAKILSAPMVALSANSPYLFGYELWDETRIPLFEQAIKVGDTDLTKRVTLGIGYVDSILDCFRANRDRYPVLLPQLMDEPERQLAHLRLHNGTVWRWNRPLIGFDQNDVPHIRIEHRVIPAGPTVTDSIANAAFFYGAVCALAGWSVSPESRLPYPRAKANFYQAARWGINADLQWLDQESGSVRDLCRHRLLPLAREGLGSLGIDPGEIEYWLGVISGRLENSQNGAVWQRMWVRRHGQDMAGLTEAYLINQESGRPVHQWDV
ncbi:MAG: glutamate--cysteine ligase [Gammaproteobacteria bacterium]|nr:glutamate--cysteine ligase [Gammaproteobacteria bacterium]